MEATCKHGLRQKPAPMKRSKLPAQALQLPAKQGTSRGIVHVLPSLSSPIRSFIAFRVPYSPAIGVKLISTPWTDKNLEHAEGITAEQLRQEHRSKGMPADLANILELAGQADVRILILDADAPVLLGLPLAEP